jgi:hypothetical protein
MGRELSIALLGLVVTACNCSQRATHGPLYANPDSIDFGTTAPGSRVDSQFVVTNEGSTAVVIQSASINAASAPFSVSPAASATLGPGESITYATSYLPTAAGNDSAQVIIQSNAPIDPTLTVALSGIASTSSCTDTSCTNPPNQCYRPGGTCSNGMCIYALLAANTPCDDQNPCTYDDVCSSTGVCFGTPVLCGSVPNPTCSTPQTSETFSGPAMCNGSSTCTWTTKDTACSDGCDSTTGLCAQCMPTSCSAQGKNCGTIPDGCGGTLNCGSTCPSGETCGGSGVANVCGSSSCTQTCLNWTDCKTAGTGCDAATGCCVPCGGDGQPCCVNFTAGYFFCGSSADVCGLTEGTGTTETYYCCANAGDGCCQPGECGTIGDCCNCPQNGLNFCVDPSFGCSGC